MLNNNKLFVLIDKKYQKNKVFTFFYYLLLPISQWVEIFYFKKLWVNDILERFAENTNLIDFLNKNEFAIIDDKYLLKQDLLPEEYYKLTEQELKQTINREFIEAFLRIIKEEFITDYENLMTIISNIEITKERIMLYSVEVNFYRYHIIKRNKQTILKKWLPITFLLLVTITYFLIFKTF